MNEDQLQAGKNIPAGMILPAREDVLSLLEGYGIVSGGRICLIDTSHDENDIRLNYIIDNQWVLRLCNAPGMTEKRIQELNRLIQRYIDFGLKCPLFIADEKGTFFHKWNGLSCYLSQYIDLRTAEDVKEPQATQLWNEVLDMVAGFADRYRNVDLSETYGMYSLFDLSPFDIPEGKDEKQQNFNNLCETLEKLNEPELVERLKAKHSEIRNNLKAVYKQLPRCVFQADENFSNILIDQDGHLAGLIDFNLAGTEVIVNQFANLGSGFCEDVLEPIGAKTRMDRHLENDMRYRERLLSIYHATDLEKQAMNWYGWIAMTAGWPQVCFFREGLKRENLKDEILDLLSMLADWPC
ncbi:MAG: phosphotransferase [Erysipelotrichaceae bacterium]|nr:phosphotransferase [Erysipelotrichaceae bacterium]